MVDSGYLCIILAYGSLKGESGTRINFRFEQQHL